MFCILGSSIVTRSVFVFGNSAFNDKIVQSQISHFSFHLESDFKGLKMGWKVKTDTDMEGQATHGLWGSNVKTEKY